MDVVSVLGVEVHPLTMSEAMAHILRWSHASEFDCCRVVVTPNVNHVVMLQSNEDFRTAYRSADLVLADGQPLILASRCGGCPLPERIAGSDLAPMLFAATREPLTVYLLGAAEGVAERAKRRIEQEHPLVRVVGTYSPPLGFENDDAQNEAILQRIAAATPDVLVLGLGAPKQELWASRHKPRLKAKVVLCIGATIDFMAGERRRAPQWMRRVGLEWVFRVAQEPRRLAGRYLSDAVALPRLLLRELISGGRARPSCGNERRDEGSS